MRFLKLAILITGLVFSGMARAETPAKSAILYKTPQCGCCENYANYLRRNGFSVTVKPTHDLALIKRQHAVPKGFEGCHTMLVEDYVVEGHMPLKTLKKLLRERPKIKGISLPGMPQGSPGMTGRKTAPFTIYQFGPGRPKVYAID